MEQARVERSIVLDASPAVAWSRLVGDFGRWFGDGATLVPSVGGRVTSGCKRGHVTEIEDQALLRWEWSQDDDPGWTEIEISLRPVGSRTEVHVVEVLNAWEQVTYGALGVDGPSRGSELAVSAR